MSADTVTPPPVSSRTVPNTRAKSRRTRWLLRLLPVVTLLLLCVWFAPAIVAKTELRNQFARQSLADVHGSVNVGSASLGWFSPVELRDVVIKDEAGRAIVTAPKITSQKSLIALARNQAEPGEFTVENPTIAVVCEKGGTNLEAAFTEYLKERTEAAQTRPALTLRVTGGTLTLMDAEDTGEPKHVKQIRGHVHIPANPLDKIDVELTAETAELGETGSIHAKATLGNASTVELVCKRLSLGTFAPLVKRFKPDWKVTGTVTTDLLVKWSTENDRPTRAVAGDVSVEQLAFSAPWLNGDLLKFDSVKLEKLDVELAESGVRVGNFDLKCDVGRLSIAGTFDPKEPENLLTRPGLSVNANVELAKLAAKLPKLLRLKEGTELREGNLVVKLVSKADAAGTVWEGKIDTSALKATRDGKPIAWEQPLHVEFLGRYAKDQLPTFDKLVCTSDFVAVNARVTPETVQAAANIYLHKLGDRLRDFVDLGGFTLDGEAAVSLVGRRERDGAFRGAATVELKNFAFTNRNGKGLAEPALKLELTATGKAPDAGPVQLATASVALTANGDELNLTLVEPVANVRELSSGSVDVHVTGDLARWKSRAATVVKIPKFDLGGSVDARGRAQFAADRITINGLTVALTRPKLTRWISLDEPNMNAVGDLTFTRATRVATISNVTLNCATLSVTNGTVAFELPEKGDVVVSGNGQCTTDLNRLGKTVRLYEKFESDDALHGRGVGPLRFRTNGDITTFGGTLDVTGFGYGPKTKFVWFEPTLKLEADGSYSDPADTVTLAVAKAERPGLAVDAKGTLAKITATRDVNFAGTMRYDWAKLTPLVRDFVGKSFNATGTGSRAFVLSGQLEPGGQVATTAPPTPEPKTGGPITLKAPGAAAPKPPAVPTEPSIFAALSGEAALGWNSISAYGFDIGTGELSAKLARGTATVAPITATFGNGRVTLAPTLMLATTPFAVTLAKGTVIDHAHLTPTATAGALGYALPAIANTGVAEGEISATIDDNRISLGDIAGTNLKGTLVIHHATVGLSPVAAQIANLLGAKATTMTLVNGSTVPVQVANGRVHHQNFAVRISGTTFHTSGSVGFDDTLDLVVDVPLPKDMPLLKNNAVLTKAVAGKVVKVPMKGTLTKPELDAKAFEHAVIALAREGAKDVGKDLLEGELRKLFPGMPATGTNPKPGGFPFPLPFGKKP